MSRSRFFSIVVAVEEVGVDGSSESSPINKEDLLAHLNAFPKNRLVEEVVSMWEELGELERELAMARQRARALDGELVNVRSKSGGRADFAELEERFRVAEARRSQLETMLANEQGRRKDLEEVVGEGRVDELRRENVPMETYRTTQSKLRQTKLFNRDRNSFNQGSRIVDHEPRFGIVFFFDATQAIVHQALPQAAQRGQR